MKDFIKDFFYERWIMLKTSVLFIFQKENFITLSYLFYLPFWWHIAKWTGALQDHTLVHVLSLDMTGTVWIVVCLIFLLTLISCNLTYQGLELFGIQKKVFMEEDDE